MSNPPNPKKLMGDKKPPLHLLPMAGMVHQAMAHFDGDLKYGFENWNDTPVEKLTYIGAMLRHAELYKYGENFARDTNVHNLGAVMACCAILLDAELNGNLIDNTRHSKAACDLLHNAEGLVEALKEMQKAREAKKAEQERIDNSWVAAANADHEELLKADALARQRSENLDGSPRRETFLIKPEEITDLEKTLYSVTPIETCNGCKTKYECQRVGVCFHPPKFTTCGKCPDIQECGGIGRCVGR